MVEGNKEATIQSHWITVGMIFFAVSYFIQNLFVFDQITTLVPVVIFLGFVTATRESEHRVVDESRILFGTKVITTLVAILAVIVLIFCSLIPTMQMSKFIHAMRENSPQLLAENLDGISQPYTYVQGELRDRMLRLVHGLVAIPEATPMILRIQGLAREVVDREPASPKILHALGILETNLAKASGDFALLTQAEADYQSALKWAPRRQEIMFFYALNLVTQGRIDDAIDMAKEILQLEPLADRGRYYYATISAPYDWDGEWNAISTLGDLFVDEGFMLGVGNRDGIILIREVYNTYMRNFYQAKNSNAFLSTMKQALELEKIIDLSQQILLEKGVIQEVSPSRVSALEMGIKSFTQRGWTAVVLGT